MHRDRAAEQAAARAASASSTPRTPGRGRSPAFTLDLEIQRQWPPMLQPHRRRDRRSGTLEIDEIQIIQTLKTDQEAISGRRRTAARRSSTCSGRVTDRARLQKAFSRPSTPRGSGVLDVEEWWVLGVLLPSYAVDAATRANITPVARRRRRGQARASSAASGNLPRSASAARARPRPTGAFRRSSRPWPGRSST